MISQNAARVNARGRTGPSCVDAGSRAEESFGCLPDRVDVCPVGVALRHIKCNCRVFPACEDSKRPLVRWSSSFAETDRQAIRLWRIRPQAMVAIVTGAPSGLWVVDIDHNPARGHDAARIRAEFTSRFGVPETTPVVSTPGGGWHYYFAAPSGLAIPTSASRLAPGVDVRGDGGYIIAAGSVRADGREYAFENSRRSLIRAPKALLDALIKKEVRPAQSPPSGRFERAPGHITPYGDAALNAEVRAVASAQPGTRNERLNRASFCIGQLVAAHAVPADWAGVCLFEAALAAGLGEREALATIKSGLTAGLQHPRSPHGGKR